MNDSFLRISPIEDYKAPEIPTFQDNNSALLKKMPSRWQKKARTFQDNDSALLKRMPPRWQKKARIIVGLGLLGSLVLSGVGNAEPDLAPPHSMEHNLGYTQGSYRGFSEADLLVRLHTGGMGSSFYMVLLTEHEAFGIIRARLEAAGLNFDATPPPGIAFEPEPAEEDWGYIDWNDWFLLSFFNGLELYLFDSEKSVATTPLLCLGTSHFMRFSEREYMALIGELFEREISDIHIGTFINPRHNPGRRFLIRRPSRQRVEESRPILVRQLINQADTFIARLQSDGILERFPDVNVTINGAPFIHGEYPILINNQKMVPAHELFTALGMEVVEDINSSRLAIIATKNNIRVRASVSFASFNQLASMSVTRNGNSDWRPDRPAIFHNDTILVPLQYVADLVGATVEWHEDTRTITITY